MGSCLTLGIELSEETHVLTKQETLLEGTRRVGEPRRTVLPLACSLRFYGDRISFCISFWPVTLTQGPSWVEELKKDLSP